MGQEPQRAPTHKVWSGVAWEEAQFRHKSVRIQLCSLFKANLSLGLSTKELIRGDYIAFITTLHSDMY